jgi:macrodomain Ter protein organizer (MatP/YcbG family)
MPKVSISACLDMDVVNELVAEAKRRGSSLSEAINRILQAHLNEKAQKSRSGRGSRGRAAPSVGPITHRR